MLSKTMETAFNDQVNREMYSAYLYLAMSTASNEMGLKGFANWFVVQYHEEMLHAMKMYEFVTVRGGKARLQAIEQVPVEFSSALDMFEKTLEHEGKVTAWINDLMARAVEEKDFASQTFLQWYVTEQVEEEENDNDIIAQLRMIGTNVQGMMILDRELAQRMVTVPTDYSKGVAAAMNAAGA
jgi:ferritin